MSTAANRCRQDLQGNLRQTICVDNDRRRPHLDRCLLLRQSVPMLASMDRLDRLRLYRGQLHRHERNVSGSGLVRCSHGL